MHTRKIPALLAMSLAMVSLVACVGRDEPTSDPQPAANPSAAAAPATPPAAPADTPASPTHVAPGPVPAAGAIGFAGFGPATWGANEEQIRMAWGKDMQADAVDDPQACHYLFPLPRPAAGAGTAFMLEGGKLVRIDVDSADIAAPGGGKVGMTADAVRALYPGRIESRPHKYVEGGQYLRVTDPDGAGVLVFNVTGNVVDSWRVGVAPQVDYVEGCS